jgi:ABC-type sulfate/molybdate transport systems ATPase subunit
MVSRSLQSLPASVGLLATQIRLAAPVSQRGQGCRREHLVGEIVAMLGPDGAGKTSTIDIILGLSQPTSGQALVFG